MPTSRISNINNWIKNGTFATFNNVYSNGVNQLTYVGTDFFERIYFPLKVKANEECYLTVKFCSPSGFQCDYGDTKEYICFTSNEPSNQNALSAQTILTSAALDSSASNTPVEYTIRYTSAVDTAIYAVIDFGYMVDGVTTSLEYSDIETNGKETGWWRVDNGRLTHDDLPELLPLLSPPYPPGVWEVESGRLAHDGLPEASKMGAFADCKKLRNVTIPSTVTYIGPYAFYGTSLTEVTIPRGCVYFDTSFPSGCTVNFQ